MPHHMDLADQFERRLAENLDGHRLLDRETTGVEPEPATLAQLPARSRIDAASDALRHRSDVVADAADGLVAEMLRDLVGQAGASATHVARWAEAERALALLADLLEAAAEGDPAR